MSAASNAFFSSASASALLYSNYHEKQQNDLNDNRKRHNEKATRKQQRIKEQYKTNKDIIRSINNYFYDHTEPIHKINNITDINNDYITRVLKYMCRDSLPLEKYRYKVRSNDPEDLQELKQTLINKNPNIKNKSKFNITDFIESLDIINKCFDNNTYTIEETIIKMMFLYLDDDVEDYFLCDLETGEDQEFEQFEQDLFLILINFICPPIDNIINNKNTNLSKLSKNLYITSFKEYKNEIKYKYKIDEYNNKYFMIFEIINNVYKNIYDIYVYKINYFFNRSDGVVMSEKFIYNFDVGNIEKQKLNNFNINKLVKLYEYDKFIDNNEYFYFDTDYNNIDFLETENEPLTYIKYFLTEENIKDYERLYNICKNYKSKILYFINLLNNDNYDDNDCLRKMLRSYKDRFIGCYNSMKILKENLLMVDPKVYDSLYTWAFFDNYYLFMAYLDNIIRLCKRLKDEPENENYKNELKECKKYLYSIIFQ